METKAVEEYNCQDVWKSGYLRKQKSMHRRYFVLRTASECGPARLEYYENEKKFRTKASVPKKAVSLETCFNINKRADSKSKHMIVLYTRGESFSVAADSEEVQNEWYQAMLDLQCKNKNLSDGGSSIDAPSPVPTFKEVWQVKVWPKGLGQARNLAGIHRLCLTDRTVSFIRLHSDTPSVVLQLTNVRRCGHSENFFFVEVGRSAATGPGEFWMQVEDSVVAQNMHETLLEAMKALSEEFCQRGKAQAAGAVGGGARHHPNPLPRQVGFTRRPWDESTGLNGSCSTTPNPNPKPKPTRAPTPAKISLSLACQAPKPVPSPASSLSSSSGHGSECGVGFGSACSYGRIPPRASVSGSPSDYGSSDEGGSSPGDHSQRTPDMPGAPGYCPPGRSSRSERQAKRGSLSKRASLAPSRVALRRTEEEEGGGTDDEGYAVMSQSVGHKQLALPGAGINDGKVGRELMDNGYMAMQPGVTSAPVGTTTSLSVAVSDPGDNGDYMAMTQSSSVSPPNQQVQPPKSEGYVMMFPNGSVPLDKHGMTVLPGEVWGRRKRAGGEPVGEYMNMSPVGTEQHLQRPSASRRIYSCCSLPRSYKHTLSTRFEGEGRRVKGDHDDSGRRGNRIIGNPSRLEAFSGSTEGRRQSLYSSSSSFSSDSASSESLEEKQAHLQAGGQEGRVAGIAATFWNGGQPSPQQRVSGWPKWSQKPDFCLPNDASKANTLPRVRENLLSAMPLSPGEYVSIKCGSGRGGGQSGPRQRQSPSRHLPQSASCLASFLSLPHSPSAPLAPPSVSEYVNMNLGTPPSPAHVSSMSLSLLSFSGTSECPAAAPLKGPGEQQMTTRGSKGADSKYRENGTPRDDTKMACGLGQAACNELVNSGTFKSGAQASSMELCSDFMLTGASSSSGQDTRMIGGNPQGLRRRHCSETLSALSSSSSSSHLLKRSQAVVCRQSFEGVSWRNGTVSPRPPSLTAAQASSTEKDLNYIDLDLANKTNPRSALDGKTTGLPPQIFSPVFGSAVGACTGGAVVGNGIGSNLNTYASIDFYKSEELRIQRSGSKESTEC